MDKMTGRGPREMKLNLFFRVSNDTVEPERLGLYIANKTGLKLPTPKVTSANRSPFNAFTDLSSSAVLAAPASLFDVMKDIAKKLEEGDLTVWVGVEEYLSVSRGDGLYDLPLENFSLGSFVHPATFYTYTRFLREPNVQLQFDTKTCIVSFDFCQTIYQLNLNLIRDTTKELLVHRDGFGIYIYVFCLLAPRLSKMMPLKVGRKYVIPDLDNIFNGEYEFTSKRVKDLPGCSNKIIGGSNCLRLRLSRHAEEAKILSQFQYLGYKIYFARVQSHESITREDEVQKNFEKSFAAFSSKWAFKVLLSRGLHVSEVFYRSEDLQNLIEQLYSDDPQKLEHCLYQIADNLEKGIPVDLKKALRHFTAARSNVDDQEVAGARRVRRIVITPTRQVFLPPLCMLDNRILRDYDPDFALRVSFRDDDMNKLSSRQSDEFVPAVVEPFLRNGLRLGERHYEFLACSNSQLRDHGVWFYARDANGCDSSYIRRNMGDLGSIRCIALYVARMGQCFSTTEDSIKVEVDGTAVRTNEPDVKCEPYTFSDGTGRISRSLAEKVASALGRKEVNSVYQIRYGGCKGTVSLDPTLKGDALRIRDSMLKFESDHQQLEIASVSAPSPLFLNHSAIMLLHDLEVPTDVFLELQGNAINELVEMFYDESRAAQVLMRRTRIGIHFSNMVKSGISLTTDPLFRGMMHAVLEKSLRDIQTKARVELPLSHARNMMGAMDESGSLSYGQVFVQYTVDTINGNKQRKVLTGDVLVTKFPALHQGDIRRLQAVDVPELSHMVDCIVFPSKGRRPHPNEMAGSDLDGDEYFVTWYEPFLRNFPKTNEEPMDFPAAQRMPSFHEITDRDLRGFVVNYIQNDRLGLIANAHKAHADKQVEGIFASICQALAEKHAKAVDFQKTGICPDLDKEERVTTYPDFMGKHGTNTVYASKKALGVLYRVSRKVVNLIPREDEGVNDNGDIPNSHLLRVRSEAKFLDTKDVYKEYQEAITGLMDRYGIETEAELVSGCIRRLHLRMCQRGEMFETVEIVSLQMQTIRKTFRQRFFQQFGGEENCDLKRPGPVLLGKAATWYAAAYSGGHQRGLSFPWIVWDLLCRCRMGSHNASILSNISKDLETWSGLEIPRGLGLGSSLMLQPIIRFVLRWAEDEGVVVRAYKENKFNSQELKSLFLEFYESYQANSNRSDVEEMSGRILLEFFKWAASHAVQHSQKAFFTTRRFENFREKAQIAFLALGITGDVSKVSTSYIDDKRHEINLVIPHRTWVTLRHQGEAVKQTLRNIFGDAIENLSIRRRRGGKYGDGRLFVRGQNDVIENIEFLFNHLISSPYNTWTEKEFRGILGYGV